MVSNAADVDPAAQQSQSIAMGGSDSGICCDARLKQGASVDLNKVANGMQMISDEAAPTGSTEVKPERPFWKDYYVALSSTQDWWCLWIGIACFVPCITAGATGAVGSLVLHEWATSPFDAWSPASGAGIVIAFVLFKLLFALESWFCKKSKTLFSRGAVVAWLGVFVIGLVSFWLAQNETIKAFGMSYALWSVFFGGLLGNLLPRQMATLAPVSKQAEFFIKVGVVLLAQPLEDMGNAGARALAVAWGETLITWHLLVAVGIFAFKLDTRVVVMLSTGIGICGASAATAGAAAMDCPGDDLVIGLSLITMFSSVTMLFVPYLATHGLGFSSVQAGAGLGGSVDGTGYVVAAAALIDEDAEAMAVIVKLAQNMLLPVVIVLISMYKRTLLTYNQPPAQECSVEDANEDANGFAHPVEWHFESSASPRVPPAVAETNRDATAVGKDAGPVASTGVPRDFFRTLWADFPKFVVGYLVLCILLSVCKAALATEAFVVARRWQRGVTKWWFAIGFTSVGLSTNVQQLRKTNGIGKMLLFAATAELVDFVLSFVVAGVVFADYGK